MGRGEDVCGGPLVMCCLPWLLLISLDTGTARGVFPAPGVPLVVTDTTT